MFDVFYSGKKPGQFAHERRADNIEHAQKLSRTRYFWWIHYLADLDSWDWLFEPPPWQNQQRHTWPSQWQKDSGVYLVPREGYVDTNYHATPTIQRRPDAKSWTIPPGLDTWDTSWHPDPVDPPYIYQFATQWHELGGPVYRVPGATDVKYINSPGAKLLPKRGKHWHSKIDCEWDYSWRPHPKDPPYIYVFGNQWWNPEVMPTMEYHLPGAVERKYITHPRARLLPTQDCWHSVADCEFEFDRSWCPDPGDPPYIYVFGNQWWPAEVMPTVEYHVPGATECKYVNWPRAQLLPNMANWSVPDGVEGVDHSWCPDPGDPPYQYQFGTQWQRTGGARYTVPGAVEVKYVAWPRGTKTSKDNAWTVPDGVDTSTFDWTWHPDDTDPPFVYQFGTQHQRTGGPQYTVPGATEVKFVDQIRITTDAKSAVIFEIDHMCGNAGQIANTVRTVRYFDNYRDTLIRIAKSTGAEYEFVWVCSSICDYTDFDFSWHPEQWQATMLHVFKSNDQKFGDTFYMHVPTFAVRAEKKALLEWSDVNFVDVSVSRRPMPVIVHDSDSHVDAVKTTQWAGPLATFTNHDYVPGNLVTVPLWREQTKAIVPVSNGAGTVVVPRVAVPYIRTQLYDYAYIDRTQRLLKDPPLDIVFISNGEINAEVYFGHLKFCAEPDHKNRIHRVAGVNGRVAAYQEAARQSTTPWFFAVFAKLEVTRDFDWSWQPDRMQQPKHYIFHAHNPVNGLVYGHQAMIAYNKKLVLENIGTGLDFTLDQPHEVVPIVSGTANYHESDWMCWRTAFREVLKLKASLPDVESEHRLNRWLTVDTTPGEWSRKGAEDGVEYYDSVGGDFAELKKSYEWSWLASYAFMKRSLTPNQ